MKTKELKFEELKNEIDEKILDFNTTDDLEPFNGIIGQERALSAIRTAMQIPQKGFNLYVCGDVGIGKTNYVLSVVNQLSKEQPIPNDYCYIHNFENPNAPIAIELEPGMGIEFKQDMNIFIKKLLERIGKDLSGDIYEKEKRSITERFKYQKEHVLKEFDKSTFEQGFKVKNSEGGFYFSPVYQGKVLNEDEYAKLSPKIKKEFEEKGPKIQEQTFDVLKKLDNLDKECEKVISEWQENLATFAATQCMSDLKIKYKKNLKIQNFLYEIQSDVVKNLDAFKQYEDSLRNSNKQLQNQMMMLPPQLQRNSKPWENYKVNLIIDNDKSRHAPVVLCKTPNYFDLFGKLEFETYGGGVKTNYTMLKPGLIHKANGGYLILNVKDLLVNMPTWEAFKRVLKNQELSIDSSRDIAQPITVVSLKPEPIPINMQVVLIGSELHYQQLCALEVDFKKLFKIKADFDDFYEKNTDNIQKLAQYVAFTCKKYNLLTFDKLAVKYIIEYSSKLSNNQNRLTAIMQDISDICIEASYIAKSKDSKLVSNTHVTEAINTKIKRFSKYNDGLNNMIHEGDIIISTEGETVGQINGLTIIATGDCCFGKPVRITANTFIGKSGVVNIEREVEMSGTSHSKGVCILAAYIGQKYAQEFPLSLTASICFEQLYNGVDGDSASSTELYAILSSLADAPIKQNLAVTGSVNQKGEVQAIGGVTDKIEGFFKVCKERGLNSDNGVLIPYQNVKNLTLSDEVIEAVKEGKFHVYPVRTIDEGIEILTGIPAGTLNENNEYPENTINYLVSKKLKDFAIKSVNLMKKIRRYIIPC